MRHLHCIVPIFASVITGLPKWLSGKESTYQAGETVSIPGSGRSLGGGNDNPLQCSCLGNFMDRGAWRAKNYEVAKEVNMTEQQPQQNEC